MVSSGSPGTGSNFALTIDDGYCDDCVAAYVAFAARSGIHLTFAPNGIYPPWERHAASLRPLIEAGQVQIANHTWSHANLVRLSDQAVRTEIERNESWIQATFGITARPWFRPPYGNRNRRTDAVAANLGYSQILLWDGTLGDATPERPDELLALADQHLRAGKIVLGHANHPVVTNLFGELEQLIHARGLKPVTLDEMFGTSRVVG